MKNKTYCGYITILGRSNVGKSTIFNKLIGQKISIVSNKIQTTRKQIIGVDTKNIYQSIYMDTPGIILKRKHRLNYFTNKITNNLYNSSLILFVVEGLIWNIEDYFLAKKIYKSYLPKILVINKVDNIPNKRELLKHINFFYKKFNFINIIPICAKNIVDINLLRNMIHNFLPLAKHKFSSDYVTNCSLLFRINEIIREKLIYFLRDELPYLLKTKTEKIEYNLYGYYIIHCNILVINNNQKKIVIGNSGKMIKIIGIKSRKELEILLKKKVFLKLRVITKF